MVYLSRRLDATFGALADPTRRAIVQRLANGSQTISELASRFAMTLPAVSKHVRVLEGAGLLSIEREGRARRCRLGTASLREAAAWIARHEAYWKASFDRLADYLKETANDEEVAEWRTRRTQSTARALKGGSRRRGSGSSGRGRRRKR
jgi:DNA-binding transcriptional ArsR family regulator